MPISAKLLSFGLILAVYFGHVSAVKKKANVREVHIALRADGVSGSGKRSDPLDGSSAPKLIAILRALPVNSHISFGPGTYQIDVADINNGGFIKAGWQIRGASERLTTIQFTGSLAGINYVFILSSPQNIFTSNVRISDLTVDCNWPNLANTATNGNIVRAFDGATTAGKSTITGLRFTLADIGQIITGPEIPTNTWIGAVTDATHAMLSSSATTNVPINATGTGNATFSIVSKRGALDGIGIGGSNNRLERVRVINSYGSYGNNNECFALGVSGTDYSGVQKRGTNNWIVNCDAESPWGTYANPFAASNTDTSGVLACRAAGINDGYDGRGWTTGGVNGAGLRNFKVYRCRFTDTYGVFYQDTGPVDGLDIINNTTNRGKIGCAIVDANIKRNIRIINNHFNIQNRGPKFPAAAIQFLNAPAASNVEIRGNIITFDHTGVGVEQFRTLQAGPASLDETARVENNIGPQSLASMGDPRGFYRNNRDGNGVSWFGSR